MEESTALTHPKFSNVQTLDLQACKLTPPSFMAIIDTYNALRWLSVEDNHLYDEAVITLCQSDTMAQLEHLNLSAIKLTDAITKHITHSEFSSLETLAIQDNHLPNLFDALSQNPTIKNLKKLIANKTQLQWAQVAIFLTSNAAEHLEYLAISKNKLEAKHFRRAFAHPRLPRLKTLIMEDISPMGITSARALANANLPELETLSLSGTQMSDDCVATLAQSRTMPKLKTLKLDRANLTDKAISYLDNSPLLQQLERLSIWNTRITKKSTDVIAASACFDHLKVLDMYSGSALAHIEHLSPEVRAAYKRR